MGQSDALRNRDEGGRVRGQRMEDAHMVRPQRLPGKHYEDCSSNIQARKTQQAVFKRAEISETSIGLMQQCCRGESQLCECVHVCY